MVDLEEEGVETEVGEVEIEGEVEEVVGEGDEVE